MDSQMVNVMGRSDVVADWTGGSRVCTEKAIFPFWNICFIFIIPADYLFKEGKYLEKKKVTKGLKDKPRIKF